MASPSDPPRTVKSAETTLKIIETLRRLDGAGVSELAEHVDRSPGTIHTYLATLRQHGYVVQEGSLYRLSFHFVTLGEHVRNHADLFRAGKDEIDRLAAETGECAHLIVEGNGYEVSLYESFGDRAVGMEFYTQNREMPREHLHCTASGKVILAHLPEHRSREIIDRLDFAPRTPNTIADEETLSEMLERVRERGFALNDEEEIQGMRAAAAPITDRDDAILGAVSLSAPVRRMEGDSFRREIPSRVVQVANIIEVNLQTTDLYV
ncbi:IclR family transcriptional regulator [Halegenticoccus tardaugens]|uniref:IclR family transcriptional regulator n=1 Tax=Halegenticoccus tardaugens TaxID=2071624 RepID=UPI00100BDDE7|nr:IclR family transcriptional regulator [Halegenticoccus tardaugens]